MLCLTGSKETSLCFLQLHSDCCHGSAVTLSHRCGWWVFVLKALSAQLPLNSTSHYTSLECLAFCALAASCFFFFFLFFSQRKEGAHILLPPQHLKTKHLKYKEVRECPKQDALCFAIKVRSQIQARLAWSPLSSAQCTQRNASSMQFAVGCF